MLVITDCTTFSTETFVVLNPASGRKISHYYSISNMFYKLTLGGAVYVAATVELCRQPKL
jgi:hypothetical protein